MEQEKLEQILKNIAYAEGFTNYEVHPHLEALRGDGILSEGYTGEVIDINTETKIQAFIKVQPPYLPEIVIPAYENENRFYSRILPELKKFQIERGVKEPFQEVPKFYCGNEKEDNKYIAMENLLVQNYVLANKSVHMDKKHLELVFEKYGKFHALTFAYKDQYYENYLELIKPLTDVFGGLKRGLKYSFPAAYDAVMEINMKFAEKIKPIKEDLDNVYNDVVAYKGKYSALTHGDCWSNNMLFKYGDNGQIEDIKLLDFQLCRDSTPIHDLSYFFYSAASKEDFENIEKYLELYHKSFSTFATELGSDPEKLLPIDILKSEWKKYGLLGIMLGVMVWQPKLMKKEKIEDLSKEFENLGIKNFDDHQRAETAKVRFGDVTKSDAYRKNTSNILIHAVEYGII